MMNFEFDYIPQHNLANLIQQASARTGFSPTDIAALVNSDLDIDHLLDYITAVMSKRMN
jgi:hypothetical protein